MSVAPETGTPVVVVLRASRPQQWQGAVVALRDASLAIRLQGAPANLDAAAEYAIIHGTPGHRHSAAAAVVARNGEVVGFRLTSGWRALDSRSAQRFPTDFQAEVRSVLGGSRQPGRVVDVSAGGAAVAVDTRPGGSAIELAIWVNGYGASLQCEMVGASKSGDETILHLRFKDLPPPHRAFVRQLITDLAAREAAS